MERKHDHKKILDLKRQGLRLVEISRKMNIEYGRVQEIIRLSRRKYNLSKDHKNICRHFNKHDRWIETNPDIFNEIYNLFGEISIKSILNMQERINNMMRFVEQCSYKIPLKEIGKIGFPGSINYSSVASRFLKNNIFCIREDGFVLPNYRSYKRLSLIYSGLKSYKSLQEQL